MSSKICFQSLMKKSQLVLEGFKTLKQNFFEGIEMIT